MHDLVLLEGLLIKHIGLLNKFSLSSFAKVSTLQKAMPSPGFFFLELEVRREILNEICTKKNCYTIVGNVIWMGSCSQQLCWLWVEKLTPLSWHDLCGYVLIYRT